jgi:3-phosphoshikimate 1-carboxyvinyltransferase
LEAFGGRVEETQDGLIIEGGAPLHGADVDAAGDHRIAMTAAVVALGIRETTRIRGAEHIEVSFPGFVDALNRLGASAEVK